MNEDLYVLAIYGGRQHCVGHTMVGDPRGGDM